MKEDEAISQLREIRHMISEEHGHNPQNLVDYYIELQKQYPQLVQLQDDRAESVQTPQNTVAQNATKISST